MGYELLIWAKRGELHGTALLRFEAIIIIYLS